MKGIFLLLVILAPQLLFSQNKFLLKNASEFYDVLVEVEKCSEGYCDGKASFTIFQKGKDEPFQVIRTEDTYITLYNDTPTVNVNNLYDEQSVVFIEDFNFDGHEDISVRNGNFGGYGSPSYDVYLFDTVSVKFTFNQELSDLASGESLGMFDVKPQEKLLFTFSKSGCCWHQMKGYEVLNNLPVVIYIRTEDATNPESGKVKITEEKYDNGIWTTDEHYEEIEQ